MHCLAWVTHPEETSWFSLLLHAPSQDGGEGENACRGPKFRVHPLVKSVAVLFTSLNLSPALTFSLTAKEQAHNTYVNAQLEIRKRRLKIRNRKAEGRLGFAAVSNALNNPSSFHSTFTASASQMSSAWRLKMAASPSLRAPCPPLQPRDVSAQHPLWKP